VTLCQIGKVRYFRLDGRSDTAARNREDVHFPRAGVGRTGSGPDVQKAASPNSRGKGPTKTYERPRARKELKKYGRREMAMAPDRSRWSQNVLK